MQISSLFNLAFFLAPLFLAWTVGAFSPLTYSKTSLTEATNITKPGCPSKCGNLTVPYPFGIGLNSGCSLNPFFDILCNSSYNPPKAFLRSNGLEVIGINETKIRIRNRVAWGCLSVDPNQDLSGNYSMDLRGTSFSFSNENKLTVVGCDDIGIISSGTPDFDYFSSCVAICSKTQDLTNGSCSGIGCCQASIPKGLQYINGDMFTLNGHEKVQSFNPCGYTFLAEQNRYEFLAPDVNDPSFVDTITENVPLVIDWAIGNRSCSQVGNTNECVGESVCVDSGTEIGGYRCNCSQGYEGNPYLSPGCIDINECHNFACPPNALCINSRGSYKCSCPPGYLTIDTENAFGCIPLPRRKKTGLYAGLLGGLGLFLLLVVTFWLYKVLKKRRIKQMKEALFKRNGGLLLHQQISSHDHVLEKMTIFTVKELEKATDKFNESRILGQGGQGTVYKGMLPDGTIVAVKKSKQVNENHLGEFINEVVILSQINHRNVVRLLGCCLETEVPLLVYEFVPNGSLYDFIHDDTTGFPFSWDLRLRIAAEIANALAYLHYATSIPVFHRDMKSNNILLDEKYRAKLSDFGISRSVAIDQTHFTTKVKGTFGYLDPEYFQTGKFTEKSDVYSFGVVLIELLTRQKPISTSVTDEERSLVTRFLLTMEENQLKTILDPQLIEHDLNEEHCSVAKLAKRCLNLNGKKRPTIREVTMELESIRTSENPSFVESNIQDESFIEMDSLDFSVEG
ncbi:hypothetical protein BUALT_Bualt10G0115900 [Buddleja alternifolia]|uniref:Uncharacterized protein n=1 Tax=Buddleja alternifolia TaxID=168488 RepID=A0AAV6X569_9LAMI|nr:hypothetical protein BUALT_Bualt10G0115900 [Buddleja alternifolia]